RTSAVPLQRFSVGAHLAASLRQNRQPVSSCFPDLPEGKARLSTVRGVTETEIRLGMSAPFSGSARELGRGLELGIRTYLRSPNDQGGMPGRRVRPLAPAHASHPHP